MRRASFWFTATTVETVPTATHNTTLSPASRALERGRSVRQYPTHVPDPLSSFAHAVWRFLLRRAPRGGTPSMISATELVQIAAPARSTGFVTFSGSLGSAKVFRAEPHEARYGCVKGRASGQLFLAASRARPPLPPRHTRGIPEQLPPCLRRPPGSGFIAN